MPEVIKMEFNDAPPIGCFAYVNENSIEKACFDFKSKTGRMPNRIYIRNGRFKTIYIEMESDDELDKLCRN